MDWTAIVIALISGGAIGAFFKWLSDRGKIKADSFDVLARHYEDRLTRLTCRINDTEKDLVQLKIQQDILKDEIDKRDDMIAMLQKENAELKEENERKEKKIAKLQSQVKELQGQVATLTARIDELTTDE